MKRDSVKCTICSVEIEIGTGRYNFPGGTECTDCHDNPNKRKKEPKYVKIAGHKIPYKMLEQYAEVVDYTRRAALIGQVKDDPQVIMQALQNRVEIHKKIFKITGHDHESMEPAAMKIRNALEKWLEKNVMTKPQAGGLV